MLGPWVFIILQFQLLCVSATNAHGREWYFCCVDVMASKETKGIQKKASGDISVNIFIKLRCAGRMEVEERKQKDV